MTQLNLCPCCRTGRRVQLLQLARAAAAVGPALRLLGRRAAAVAAALVVPLSHLVVRAVVAVGPFLERATLEAGPAVGDASDGKA